MVNPKDLMKDLNSLISTARNNVMELRELGYRYMSIKPITATFLMALSHNYEKHAAMLEALRRIMSLTIETTLSQFYRELSELIDRHVMDLERVIEFIKDLITGGFITEEAKSIANLILRSVESDRDALIAIKHSLT